MNVNEDTRPVAGTTGRAEAGKNDFGEASFPTFDFNINFNKTQQIFDLLPQGEDHAIQSKALAELVGAKSVRDLQSMIAVERAGGALILSTCRGHGGYFQPDEGEKGKQEILRYIATLRSRVANTFRAFRGEKAAIAADTELSGQIDFEEMEALF